MFGAKSLLDQFWVISFIRTCETIRIHYTLIETCDKLGMKRFQMRPTHYKQAMAVFRELLGGEFPAIYRECTVAANYIHIEIQCSAIKV